MCKKCYALYSYKDCITVVDGKQCSKKCSFVATPFHMLQHLRRPCGEMLLKSVSVNSKTELVAKKNLLLQKSARKFSKFSKTQRF